VRLVLDANVLFAALIKDGHTRHVLLNGNLELFAPRLPFEEVRMHSGTLAKRSGMERDEIDALCRDILKGARIGVIPDKDVDANLGRSRGVCPDPDDAAYLAAAMAVGCPMWSNDEALKAQDAVEVLTTEEVMHRLIRGKDF
jgi:predicted nucleic acid-binding protein